MTPYIDSPKIGPRFVYSIEEELVYGDRRYG